MNSLNGKIRNDEILFKEVEKFLNPTGKLFQLIDKLVNENVTFDLPSALLPVCNFISSTLLIMHFSFVNMLLLINFNASYWRSSLQQILLDE